ncbi:unnamed protein product [Rhizophagus irregularis]|uniref:Uncharacterized protein n=1 Tax=Rhizophagus irregularis TaxID=588596 RepID=A0A915ZMK6_9GLOM|nr:unnamed protein product [Rhizophagus irregularis]
MIIYVKTNNSVKGKYGLIINYNSEIINEIYLGNVNNYIKDSGTSEKGFICIEEHDKRGIAAWHWLSTLDITTGKVVELGSGELNNQGAEYDNPVIESTKPAVNEVIDSSINFITIKYAIRELMRKLGCFQQNHLSQENIQSQLQGYFN